MKFKEIWFDLDGTLAVPDEAWHKAHDELRYKVYAEYLGTEVTNTLRKEFDKLYEKYRSNSAVFRSLGLPAGYWIDHFEEADMSSLYPVRDEVPTVLETLSKRAALGLFTNNKLPVVLKTLDRLGIPSTIFNNMVTGDEVSERKPHPHGFELMLNKADCRPNEIIYIGDRYHVDVEPAQKLGIKGGLVWSADERADYSFPEFIDLLKLNT